MKYPNYYGYKIMNVQIKIANPKIGTSIPHPSYATTGSAGLDLRACIEKNLVVAAGQTVLIPTGISIYLEDPAYAGLIIPRSGLGHKHGIVLGNLVGLLDSDYQGELMVSCWNRSNEDFEVEVGDRIAQLAIIPVMQPSFKAVEEFEESVRGEGGFGHTGKA